MDLKLNTLADRPDLYREIFEYDLIEKIEPLLRQGFRIRREDDTVATTFSFIWDTPWITVYRDLDRECLLWHQVLFRLIKAMPSFCMNPEKLGYGVARNLIQSGYPGAVHFVSQKQGELCGLPLHIDLNQIPDPVDMAVLIVPPQAMQKTIEDCGQRDIKAAIIMSSGFREVGPEGAALEQRCLDVARMHNIRLLGPNCIGTIDTHLPLDTSFLTPPMPAKGHIGFISHSGAFCAAIIDWARGQGFGFSHIVSLGNHADLDEADILSHALLATAIERGIGRGEFRQVDVEMNVHALAASLVMLSLWKCSFGPCSQRPIDASAYIDKTVDTFVTSLKCGATKQADATECANRGVKRTGTRTTG